MKQPGEEIWHDGPPPHVGWWNASATGNKNILRWWDGAAWSEPVWPSSRLEGVAREAARKPRSSFQSRIRWSSYYPANARVPRLDPTGGHWTYNVDGSRPDVPDDTLIEVVYGDGEKIEKAAHKLPAIVWMPGHLKRLNIVAWRIKP